MRLWGFAAGKTEQDHCKPPCASELPMWRGFNLQSMFYLDNARPYDEWTFDFMAEHGFDFARLPLDYRIWTKAARHIDDSKLKWLDQAVQWCMQRRLHVCICLHRAPGYTVAQPPEPADLFGEGMQSEAAREEFARQWGMFAQRYGHIPGGALSFNLVNEPAKVSGAVYAKVAKVAIEAIRQHDHDRLIIADGISWGTRPVRELLPLGVAQSTRGYAPFRLTHYGASWIGGNSSWPEPQWPLRTGYTPFLYGSAKPDWQSPLILRGEFAAGTRLTIRVGKVSQRARLVVQADNTAVMDTWFRPGPPNAPEWKTAKYEEKYGVWSADYDRECSVVIPVQARTLRLDLPEGDWLTIPEVRIELPEKVRDAGNSVVVRPTSESWGERQGVLEIDGNGHVRAGAQTPIEFGCGHLEREIGEWARFAANHHVGVMVGEWGAYKHTPHEHVLAWMGDCLRLWRRAGMGWALWELAGGFGVLDSGRKDVHYENWHGHQLDRRMLELLQRHDSGR